jgi:hypothetical protein
MTHDTDPCCEQDPNPRRKAGTLPSPSEVLYQAIDMIQADVDTRTKAAHEAMASLEEAVRLLVSYEEALRRIGGESKPKPRRKTSIPRRERRHKTQRSPLGLTPNGQTVYDALPEDGAKTSLKELRQITGLDPQALAVVASHLARQHPHLVERLGVSVYRRAKGAGEGA